MTFVDMDSIDFYQPPSRVDQPGDRRHPASNNGVPNVGGECETSTALGPSDGFGGRLQDYSLIGFLDMAAPSLEVLDPICKPAPANTNGKNPCLWVVVNGNRYLERTPCHSQP